MNTKLLELSLTASLLIVNLLASTKLACSKVVCWEWFLKEESVDSSGVQALAYRCGSLLMLISDGLGLRTNLDMLKWTVFLEKTRFVCMSAGSYF